MGWFSLQPVSTSAPDARVAPSQLLQAHPPTPATAVPAGLIKGWYGAPGKPYYLLWTLENLQASKGRTTKGRTTQGRTTAFQPSAWFGLAPSATLSAFTASVVHEAGGKPAGRFPRRVEAQPVTGRRKPRCDGAFVACPPSSRHAARSQFELGSTAIGGTINAKKAVPLSYNFISGNATVDFSVSGQYYPGGAVWNPACVLQTLRVWLLPGAPGGSCRHRNAALPSAAQPQAATPCPSAQRYKDLSLADSPKWGPDRATWCAR